MRTFPRWLRGPVVAVVSALTAAGAALVALAPAAHATSSFTFTQISGSDRFQTAALIAEQAFPKGSTNAIIATGTDFPDALAGSYLAGELDAPILLVNPTDPVPSSTLAALSKLGVKDITILGGTAAVGADVQATLSSDGYTVTRLFGPTRYDTMEAVDTAPPHTVGSATIQGNTGPTGILATGNNFPDALGAGPLAFAMHFPIILTDGTASTLSPQAQAVIKTDGITNLIVVGGSAAINPAQYSASALSALGVKGVDTSATTGVNRSQTSVELAQDAVKNGWLAADSFDVANGCDTSITPAVSASTGIPVCFTPDALAGSVLAGSDPHPILITNSPSDPGFVTDYASQDASNLTTPGFAFGGSGALETSTLSSIATAGGGKFPAPTTNQAYTVSPSTPQTVQVSTPSNPTAGDVTYTVSGLPTNASVDLALWPADGADAPVVGANGTVTFTSSGGPGAAGTALGQASTDGNNGYIASVNGAPQATGTRQVLGIGTGASGSLSFVLNSTLPDRAVPVVWTDTNANGMLDVGPSGAPTEPFGLGGEAIWASPPATTGTYNSEIVQSVNTSAHTFEACTTPANGATCNTFSDNLSASNTYYYTSPNVFLSQAQFETYLSGQIPPFSGAPTTNGDVLDINYNANGPSIFGFVDDVPAPVTGVGATYNATASPEPGVVVSWTGVANPDVANDPSQTAEYCVERATVTNGVVGPFAGFNDATGTGNASCAGGTNNAITATAPSTAPATSLVDTSVAANTTYEYEVIAVPNAANGGTGNESAPALSPQVTTPATAAQAPVSTQSVLTQGSNAGNNPHILDVGDTLQFVFTNVSATSPLTVASNASITLADSYGAQVTLTNGTNASFVVSGNGTTLTIAVNGTPTLVSPASPNNGSPTPTSLNTDVPDAVVSASGITDAAGPWNLAASGCEASTNGCGAGTFQRTADTAGTSTNVNLPDAITAANVTATAPNTVAITTAGADSGNGNHIGPATGDTVDVFNAAGAEIGSGTWNASATTNTITTTTAFSPGATLFVVYVDNGTGASATNQPSETTQVTAPVGTYTFSPTPIAPNGSLGNSATVPVTLTVKNQQGNPVPGATVYLSFSSSAPHPGSASVGGTPLSGTPAAFTANSGGQVTITYTSSSQSITQSSGTDTITAQNNPALPTLQGTDTYTYGTPVVTSVSPSTASPGAAVTVNGTGFQCPVASVTFGGFSAGVTSCSSTAIGVTVPSGPAPGTTVNVVVTNPNGETSGSSGNGKFTYASGPPTISLATVLVSTQSVVVDYNQPVNCHPGDTTTAAAFSFTDNYNGPSALSNSGTAGTAISQMGPAQCEVTFGNYSGNFTGNDFGTLNYAEPASPTDQVSNGNGSAPSQANVPVSNTTAVSMSSAINAATGSTTINVTYNLNIDCATVDLNGSDYTVTVGGASDGVVSAKCSGTIVNNQSNTVSITVLTAPASTQSVTVTSQTGTDGNTVGDTAGNFDAVGDHQTFTAL